jgi:outer membrane protein assembly factor BamB
VNAPGVEVNGTVFANSEDGNLYEIDRSGKLVNQVFTQLAIGAAYTPLSIGPDGRIYTQNDGRLFVVGN